MQGRVGDPDISGTPILRVSFTDQDIDSIS
jgi:hypothetical protein